MKERNYGIDLLRIFLCLCVITFHTLDNFGINNYLIVSFIQIFLLQANDIFYMISGYFNLSKEIKDCNDIKKYYKSKFITVLLPFMAFILVWAVWDYVYANGTINILEILDDFYKILMYKGIESSTWFLYPLFGMLLSAPFLSKMLHNMDDKEIKVLWNVAIGWNILQYYLCYNLGYGFGYGFWLLDGWPLYFFGGYYYKRIAYKESKLKWYVLGITGLVGTFVGANFLKRFGGTTDSQTLFTLFCMGCFMFFDKSFVIKNKYIQKIIVFISKNTFMIYLFHTRALEYVLRKMPSIEADLGRGILVVVGVFLVSLLLAEIANLCLKPIQKLIDKVWVIK